MQNIAEVASANGKQAIEEIKRKQRICGFNSIFAVSSVDAAKLYYAEFKKQMEEDPTKKLKIARMSRGLPPPTLPLLSPLLPPIWILKSPGMESVHPMGLPYPPGNGKL